MITVNIIFCGGNELLVKFPTLTPSGFCATVEAKHWLYVGNGAIRCSEIAAYFIEPQNNSDAPKEKDSE